MSLLMTQRLPSATSHPRLLIVYHGWTFLELPYRV
ncbi:hypothetical protein Goari_025591, partial [Gossypium aridum]|nr:hypothetical protein [Gossypium aridum]